MLFQDLVANGAQVSICNKYGETPLDKAKPHLQDILKGMQPSVVFSHPTASTLWFIFSWLCLSVLFPFSPLLHCDTSLPPPTERAEKLGQNLNKIPYKDTFWKGTTRTRPRTSHFRILYLWESAFCIPVLLIYFERSLSFYEQSHAQFDIVWLPPPFT